MLLINMSHLPNLPNYTFERDTQEHSNCRLWMGSCCYMSRYGLLPRQMDPEWDTKLNMFHLLSKMVLVWFCLLPVDSQNDPVNCLFLEGRESSPGASPEPCLQNWCLTSQMSALLIEKIDWFMEVFTFVIWLEMLIIPSPFPFMSNNFLTYMSTSPINTFQYYPSRLLHEGFFFFFFRPCTCFIGNKGSQSPFLILISPLLWRGMKALASHGPRLCPTGWTFNEHVPRRLTNSKYSTGLFWNGHFWFHEPQILAWKEGCILNCCISDNGEVALRMREKGAASTEGCVSYKCWGWGWEPNYLGAPQVRRTRICDIPTLRFPFKAQHSGAPWRWSPSWILGSTFFIFSWFPRCFLHALL